MTVTIVAAAPRSFGSKGLFSEGLVTFMSRSVSRAASKTCSSGSRRARFPAYIIQYYCQHKMDTEFQKLSSICDVYSYLFCDNCTYYFQACYIL